MSRRTNHFSQGLVVALVALCVVAVVAYLSRPQRTPAPTASETSPSKTERVVDTQSTPDQAVLTTETPGGSTNGPAPGPAGSSGRAGALSDRQPASDMPAAAGRASGAGLASAGTRSDPAPATRPLSQGWEKLVPDESAKPLLIPLANVSRDDAQKHLESGDLLQARAALNAQLLASPSPEVKAKLAELNRQIVFSTRRFPDDPFGGTYAVQNGDSLQKIARAHGVTWELLCRLNDISDPRKLRAGRAIKIINGPFHAVVHKSRFEMDIWLGEPESAQSMYVTTFRVGLGKDSSTPTGT
ncbi:MAG: LysM peptidoglycan-binding domain-containing protein, partial [Phycisphaerae bacterium]|nr:LysM peptidoglycan-binding domain-containing protein [Phycisphaerae bacterium]